MAKNGKNRLAIFPIFRLHQTDAKKAALRAAFLENFVSKATMQAIRHMMF